MLRIPAVLPKLTADHQLQIAREVLQTESRSIGEVSARLDKSFVQAVESFRDCTGSILVTGMGKAGLVGQKVSATLASTGTRSHFLHPAEAVHGDLGRIATDDLILAFSHSGETAEITQILQSMNQLGAGVIGVTSRRSSSLARMARVAIAYGPVDEACPIGMAPSSSCAVMMAIGDALAFVLMRLREFGDEDFGRYHPAGSLGRRLKSVAEIMRTGEQLRIASSTASVSEVFTTVQRPGRRTGAVMLVDERGRLAGLFTDSDLARLFERRQFAAFERPIAECMTRQPITLRLGQRVTDALSLLRDRQVSEIPVLDDADRPVGLVDITDVMDLMPEAA